MKYIKTLQASVLKRALGDKAFESVYQQYLDARLKSRSTTPPTKSQIKLASLVKQHGASKAGEMVGVAAHVADYAYTRVARYEYLTK